jgi:hypothetical protein
VRPLRQQAVLVTGRVPDGLLRRLVRRRLAERLEQLGAAAGGDAAAALRPPHCEGGWA